MKSRHIISILTMFMKMNIQDADARNADDIVVLNMSYDEIIKVLGHEQKKYIRNHGLLTPKVNNRYE